MKTIENTMKTLFFATVLLAASLGTTSGAFTFIEDGVMQSVTAIKISPNCGDDSDLVVPNIMFTIEPANSVTVASQPSGLVTVSGGSTMTFKWNPDVAATANSGGVKIGIPAAQLTRVSVELAKSAQIMDGFTSVAKLDVSGASTLFATFSSSTAPFLDLNVSGSSTVNVKSNINVNSGSISGSSVATVETPSYNNLEISGASTLNVNGVLGGSGTVSGFSSVTATGDVTGSINISGASTINALSCGTVSNYGASTCNSGSQSVTVDVSQQATSIDGQGECSGGGSGIGEFFGDMFSGAESPSTIGSAIVGVGVAAATAATIFAM